MQLSALQVLAAALQLLYVLQLLYDHAPSSCMAHIFLMPHLQSEMGQVNIPVLGL